MYSVSAQARAAVAEYDEVVKRRLFMEAQMEKTQAGRAQLAKIREERAARAAAKARAEGREEAKEGEAAGEAAQGGMGAMAGLALLAA